MADTTLYPGKAFSPQATITDNIGAADTVIPVSDVSAFPDAPNYATIGTDEDGETIKYTAKTASALSGCQRGLEGAAKSWQAGEPIARNFTAADQADMIAAIGESKAAAAAAQSAAGNAQDAADDAQEALAPEEAGETASRAYAVGEVFLKDGTLYKATAAISQGGTIEPGTNCTPTTLGEAIHEHESDTAAHVTAAEKTSWSAKQAAPQAPGTAGQVLGLDNDLNPVWLDPSDGMAAEIIVTTQAGDVIACTKNDQTTTKTAEGTSVVFKVSEYGTYNISGTRSGLSSDVVAVVVDTVAQYAATLSYFSAEIVVTSPAGSSLTCTGPGGTQTKTSTGSDSFIVTAAGTYTITGTLNGQTASDTATITASGDTATATIEYFSATINVTAPSGSSVTVKLNGETVNTHTATGSAVAVTVTEAGTYAIEATDGSNVASGSITISASGESKSLELSYVHIYSVSWDGSSTPALTRGDDAALFTDPVPAVGTGSGSSPFDNLYPWSGMTRVTDGNNVLVKIPKFWVKVTHNPFKLQIADKAVDGYQLSPAHRDRGDGVGERDVVYIGRYECDDSYMSRTGKAPKVSTTLATFRSGIAALGAEYWQADYAIQLTWLFLYLVEFANWNGQATIGRGVVDVSAKINTGGTDSMTYHTGRAAGTDGAVAIQYRNIENPWGNVWEWRDGIIFSDANICTYNNPANFSDSYNGAGATVRSNKRPTSSGYISAWSYDTSDPSFIYAGAVAGSDSTYICDHCWYGSGVRALSVSGAWDNASYVGPFALNGDVAPSDSYATLGSRLQKLPSAA